MACCLKCRQKVRLCCCEDQNEEFVADCEERQGASYKVTSYDYNFQGRGGTSYQLVEQRVMAHGKHKDRLEEIALQLNQARELKRLNRRLRARVQTLLETEKVTVDSVRSAIIHEVTLLPHCRWSSHRKQIVDFGKRVLGRLGRHNTEIDPCN